MKALHYNVTGQDRKELVGIISKVVGMKAVYKFMPTCAFVIDNLTIDKEGTLIADDRTDKDTLRKVLEAAEAAGFKVTPDMMRMMGGFTLIRLCSMLGTANIKVTKEQLLALNAALNRIRK